MEQAPRGLLALPLCVFPRHVTGWWGKQHEVYAGWMWIKAAAS